MIKNPKTGRMVKKDGVVGKRVLKEAATVIQKHLRGKRNRNLVKTKKMSNKTPPKMTMTSYLAMASEAGFNIRYAREYANYHNYFPSVTELNGNMNSNFALNLQNHFGINNLRPGTY